VQGRRAFALSIAILAAAAALVFGGQARAAEPTAKPNIVLVMADDLGWADTSYNGNPVLETPNLDAMADAGLRFNRFYSAAPVCSPTRGSVLTGRHPYRYGIVTANAGHMLPQEITLAEILKKKGYATGHFGKWHLGTLTKTVRESNRGGPKGAKHYSPPWENGFDECFSTEAKTPTWDPLWRPQNNNSRTWWDPVRDLADAVPYGTNYWANGQRVTEPLRGDDSKVIMDRALPFIQRAAKEGKPFLAVIWFHAPHLPVVAGKDYTAPYAKHGQYAAHYFGCIAALDEQVGRLRAELKALGVAKNTLVAFCSDNGPEGRAGSAPGSAGKLRGRKRDLFEGGVRVPGIVVWPATIKPGSVTDVPACTSDYLPTVLDALGARLPDSRPLDGVSLLPLFRGSMTERPSPIGFESGRQAAWTDNRYKLVRLGGNNPRRGKKKGKAGDKPTAAAKGQLLLFDLVADPGEKNDIAAANPEIVKRMSAQLEAWRAACRASRAGKDYAGG